jgi:hypothetical protein
MSQLLDLRSHQYKHKKENVGWAGTIVGFLAVTFAFGFFVYALPAMFSPGTCTVSQHSQTVVCQ